MVLPSYLVVFSLISVLVYLLYKLYRKTEDFWPKHGVPLLKIENMVKRLWRNTTFIEVDGQLYKQMGNLPYAGFMEGNAPSLIVKDIDLIKKIYVKDFEYFVNRRNLGATEVTMNKMLLNMNDQNWKDLRSTMSPTFSTGKIRRMFPIFNDSSTKLIKYLNGEIANDKQGNGVINMEDVLGRYSMDVIASAAFGIESRIFQDPNTLISKMAKRVAFKMDFLTIVKFFLSMIIPASAKWTGLRFINKDADEYFTTLLQKTIKHRETTGEKRNDFLQLMIDTKHGQLQEDTEEMEIDDKDALITNTKTNKIKFDDQLIISNCILFIMAGFDTVSSALMFVSYSLALNPDVQQKLKEELDDVADNQDGQLNYDEINQLEYLDKVINESMRMYPSAARTERKCTKEYLLDDSGKAKVPKDILVDIPIYQIHHDPAHFPNPEVYDPERFSPEVKATRSPYAFMPFGHGPRICIANRFALTEVKSAIANLVMNFEIEPCAKSPIPLKFQNSGSLKPVNGMWLKLKSRK